MLRGFPTILVALALLAAGCAKSPPDSAGTAAASPGPAVLSDTQRAEALAATTPSGAVQLETLDDRPGSTRKEQALAVGGGATVYAGGWAWNERGKKPCSAVALVGGGTAYPARYGYVRPDVATYFHADALTRSGYLATVPASALGTGTHRLAVVCVVDERAASTRSTFTLDVSVR